MRKRNRERESAKRSNKARIGLPSRKTSESGEAFIRGEKIY